MDADEHAAHLASAHLTSAHQICAAPGCRAFHLFCRDCGAREHLADHPGAASALLPTLARASVPVPVSSIELAAAAATNTA